MRWIRINRRWGGRLALFALALQFGLSFGHIHAEDLGLATPASAVAYHVNTSAADDGLPAQDRDGHDTCAICIALGLTASSVLPTVASLALPVTFDWKWPREIQSAQAIFRLKSYYQARAPPYA